MKKSQVAILLSSIIIIGGAVGVYFLIESLGTEITAAPDFELQDINGTSFYISDLQPKTVLLDFMSIPCIPCRAMNPVLTNLLNDTDLIGQIEIISIETVTNTSVIDLQNHAVSEGMNWTVVIAPESIQSEYGVDQIPTFVIVNPEGNITYFETGMVSYDVLKTELTDAIEGRSDNITITSYQGFVIGFAIIVAITSFFSPCSFPLMPSYVAHILGMNITPDKKEEREEESEEQDKVKEDKKENRKLWLYPLLGLSSGVGILISYLILGVTVSAVGSSILPYVVYALPIIGGIFIVLGILMFTKLEFSLSKVLNWIRKKQVSSEEKKKDTNFSKFSSTFLYGLGYGIASLGCNAPIFLAFSLQVSAQETILKMIFAYLAFALTIIILMVGATLLISVSRDAILQKLKAGTNLIKKISGMILVGVGIYLLLEFFLGG
ncbi:MAG: redoxin domain-containing protein [Candidatus Heimdallarchaeota archaeon]|nr:redoxin domain-containing protein [Candidatus Heimdallarchaeota archaeon]